MTATIWRFHIFTDAKTKCHIVPASLEKPLLADLRQRAKDVTSNVKNIVTTGMELSGCLVHQGRPWEDFRIHGLEFSIPSEDIILMALRVRELPLRVFGDRQGTPYYKLHDHLRCFVMRPIHKASLELQLAMRSAEAERRAHVFYADKVSPAEALRAANAAIAGKPIEQMPDYSGAAGHRIDRFFPKNRGSA